MHRARLWAWHCHSSSAHELSRHLGPPLLRLPQGGSRPAATSAALLRCEENGWWQPQRLTEARKTPQIYCLDPRLLLPEGCITWQRSVKYCTDRGRPHIPCFTPPPSASPPRRENRSHGSSSAAPGTLPHNPQLFLGSLSKYLPQKTDSSDFIYVAYLTKALQDEERRLQGPKRAPRSHSPGAPRSLHTWSRGQWDAHLTAGGSLAGATHPVQAGHHSGH